MKLEVILDRALNSGHCIQIGQHSENLFGYFCDMEYVGTDVPSNFGARAWNQAGHGFTIIGAIENAVAIKSDAKAIRPMSEFEIKAKNDK